MEYQEGNYPQYEYDYQTSEDNSTAQGFIGYEIYSFMCLYNFSIIIVGIMQNISHFLWIERYAYEV